jgi:hypothetical protein
LAAFVVLRVQSVAAVAFCGGSDHELMKLIEAVTQRGRRAQRASIVVSTVVRLQAGLNRQDPAAALLGSLRVRDEQLTADLVRPPNAFERQRQKSKRVTTAAALAIIRSGA